MRKDWRMLLLFGTVVACSTIRDENIGASSAKVISDGTTSTTDLSSATPNADRNLSAVFSNGVVGLVSPAWAVGFSDQTDGALARFAWSFASSASGPFTECWDGKTGCNTVDKTPLTFAHWAPEAEPALVGDGKRNVAYAMVYDSTTTSDDDQVALVTSNDGGRSFGVNPAGSTRVRSLTVGAGQGCDTGLARSPHLAIDPTTNDSTGASAPTYWAVWGHKGSGSWGGCIRSFQLDSGGNISFAGPASGGFTIDNMTREGANDGQGALLVQALDGMITVVFSNQDNVPATPSACSSNTNIGWGAVLSHPLVFACSPHGASRRAATGFRRVA